MASKERMRLTDAAIARHRPREREYTVWDTRIAGLGVRVRPSGGRSWIFLRKTGGGTRRIFLGQAELKTVEEVRRECHALAAKPGSEDKPDEIRRAVPSFRDFVAGTWKEAHCDRYKPSTQRGVRSILARQLLPAFGSTPLDRISPTRVRRWFDTYSRIGRRWRRMSLGLHGVITPEQARAQAIKVLARVRDGEDPAGDRKGARAAPTIEDLGRRVVEDHAVHHCRPRTVVGYRYLSVVR